MSNNNITYRQVGNYFISNLELSAGEKYVRVGAWGMRRKNYLMQNSCVLFNIMLADGSLWKHLTEIDKQAEEMFSRLVAKMAQAEGITEELKAHDQMAWVGAMNSIRQRVMEIINQELICC